MKLGMRYSGKRSKDVWRRIDLIANKRERNALYLFGCALQEIENRFWQALRNAEQRKSGTR